MSVTSTLHIVNAVKSHFYFIQVALSEYTALPDSVLNISVWSMPNPLSFRYFKTSPEIIQLAVMLFGGYSHLIGTALWTTSVFSVSTNQL